MQNLRFWPRSQNLRTSKDLIQTPPEPPEPPRVTLRGYEVGHLSPFCLWKGENALEGSRTTALCDVRFMRLWRKAAMQPWLCPCDACAKGELVHAEATSTSDLVFGISNLAAIELYQSYGCA